MIDWTSEQRGENKEIELFRLAGSLDATQCDYLFSVLEGRIEDGYKKLVLDCSELSYISSMGIGVLMRLHSRMKKQGGDVRLSGIRGAVADVMHLVGLDRVFHVYASADVAVESF